MSMRSSVAKKASITLPEDLEQALRKRAVVEKRTLSGIIQEASRYYLHIRSYEQVQRKLAVTARQLRIHTEDDVDQMIHAIRKS